MKRASGKWITVEAERILYVQRGRDTILCTMHEFPLGATLVLRVKDEDEGEARAAPPPAVEHGPQEQRQVQGQP